MPRILVTVALVLALAPTAAAQLLWGDDFDNLGQVGSPPGPYTPGIIPSFGGSSGGINSSMNGGWDAWFNNNAADGAISTAIFRSPPHSLEIAGAGVGGSGCDVVQWHEQATVTGGNPGAYDQLSFPPGTFPTAGLPGAGGVWQYRAWNY